MLDVVRGLSNIIVRSAHLFGINICHKLSMMKQLVYFASSEYKIFINNFCRYLFAILGVN